VRGEHLAYRQPFGELLAHHALGRQLLLGERQHLVRRRGRHDRRSPSVAGARTDLALDGVARHDADVLVETASLIRAAGIDVVVVSAGGTPTAHRVAQMEGITEIRPGAYALSDRDQVALGWGTLEDCALSVLTTVVSRPTATRAVIDAGTKTLSSDGSFQDGAWGVVVGRPELRLVRLTEEHGILQVPDASDLPIGTHLRVIPNTAAGPSTCTTRSWCCAMARRSDDRALRA
jgi:D-serine deaminase-like pyridoxal phosphate-dependent protein